MGDGSPKWINARGSSSSLILRCTTNCAVPSGSYPTTSITDSLGTVPGGTPTIVAPRILFTTASCEGLFGCEAGIIPLAYLFGSAMLANVNRSGSALFLARGLGTNRWSLQVECRIPEQCSYLPNSPWASSVPSHKLHHFPARYRQAPNATSIMELSYIEQSRFSMAMTSDKFPVQSAEYFFNFCSIEWYKRQLSSFGSVLPKMWSTCRQLIPRSSITTTVHGGRPEVLRPRAARRFL